MLNDPESKWHLRAPLAGDGTPLAESANPTSPSFGQGGTDRGRGRFRLLRDPTYPKNSEYGSGVIYQNVGCRWSGSLNFKSEGPHVCQYICTIQLFGRGPMNFFAIS